VLTKIVFTFCYAGIWSLVPWWKKRSNVNGDYTDVWFVPPATHVPCIHPSQKRVLCCKNNQQDALYRLIYYSKSALHVSGNVFAHHQEHLTVFTVSGSVHPRCRLTSWVRWNWTMWVVRHTPHNPHSSVSTHPTHQPAASWVNTTRYCKYSQVLLTMGENNARNM
jgi:hypothetical protein